LPAGQPPKYKTAQELQDKFDNYVVECLELEKRPTISRAAYELGFASRQSLYDYESNPKFSYTIKRIKLFIESIYEENVEKGAGFIFALKNFGWTDKTEVESTNLYPQGIEIEFIKVKKSGE
jgi:hypothetical protein